MEMFVALAAKSVLVAGATLLLLKLMARRSAADRSLIAHLGLVALLVLPLAALALPALEVAGPALLAPAPAVTSPQILAATPEVAASATSFRGPVDAPPAAAIDWAFWAYAGPAALLILLTVIAVGRLAVLKGRANVLVDTHWLSALAQAQRRMGIKNGTALLTSDELSSPISWGVMRPVILLNSDAVKATAEAEAIIAHELAHLTRLDWAKLLLARVVVALCWFNPLVWLLAREAHQLREEAADDAVLASDVEDTDYANLLVGIARHECRGLLIGAHGVAPGRNSLARRVRRVLDAAAKRAPGGWRWSSAAAFFAAGMTIPVAALQFVNPAIATAADEGRFVRSAATVPALVTAMPAAIAAAPALAASSADAAAAVDTAATPAPLVRASDPREALAVPLIDPSLNPRVTIGPDITVNPGVRVAVAQMVRRIVPSVDRINRAIELKAVGASAAYVAAIRSAAPNIRIEHEDLVQFAAVGVSPAFLRDLAGAGYRGLDADAIVEARALGISSAYIRGMAAAGYGGLPISKLNELRAVGVTPGDVARFRRVGHGLPGVDQMVQIKALGIDPEDLAPDDGH